jgi:hypothetical protein
MVGQKEGNRRVTCRHSRSSKDGRRRCQTEDRIKSLPRTDCTAFAFVRVCLAVQLTKMPRRCSADALEILHGLSTVQRE